MAIAFDNSLVFNGYGDPSHDFTVGSGSDRILIIAAAAWAEISPVVAPTFNGVELTQLATQADPNVRNSAYLFYLLNPPTGTYELNATSWGYAGQAVASSWSGVHQTTPFGTPATNSGNSDSPLVAITAQTDEIVIDSFCVEIAVAAISSPQTEIGIAPDTYDVGNPSSSYRAGTGSSFNMVRDTLGWACRWATIAAALKPAGGAPVIAKRSSLGFY